ncbi:hypothetical protein [Pyrobaculum aerophilum]|uniref:Uncharacterized protein n=1 Tax=Pyrobaculum aerophilum TaxID=13773 RepID=A0A371R469_9CREN|nr:hypothetical protein [Pyrobaculum aerophilum]RFA98574.1 hypothetical protein CGL51_00725 [Pyrobaculum aerophilum]
MRRFLIITSYGKFNELPHIHGKILVAALLVSNGVRKDAEAVFYLKDLDKTVKIVGSRVKRLFPDEDSAIGFLKKAFTQGGQTGVVTRKGPRDLTTGLVIGPAQGGKCLPKPPYTYVIQIEQFDVKLDCGLNIGWLPPHHQIVVVNITTDRLLESRQIVL